MPALFSCARGSAKGQRHAYNQSGIRAFRTLGAPHSTETRNEG